MKKRIFAGSLCLALAAASVAQAAEWLYATDLSTNIIYGMPLDSLGTVPAAPISGHAAVSADHAAYLNSDELLFMPTGSGRLVHLNLETGTMQAVGELPGAIHLLRPLPGGSGALAIRTTPTNEMYLDEVIRPGSLEPFTVTSTAFSQPTFGVGVASVETGWVILRQGTPARLYTVPRDGGAPTFVDLGFAYSRLEALPDGGFVLMGPNLPAQVYNAAGEPTGTLALDESVSRSPLEAIHFGTAPFAAAVTTSGLLGRGSLVVQQGLTTDTLTNYPPPFDFGGELDTLVGASALFPAPAGEYNFHRSAIGGLHRVNPITRKVTQYFQFHRGSGPVLEGVRAVAPGPDGILYVVDEALRGMRVIAVDPATGNRWVLATLGNRLISDTIHVADSGLIALVEGRYEGTTREQQCRIIHLSGSTVVTEGAWSTIPSPSVKQPKLIDPQTALVAIASPQAGGVVRLGLSGSEFGPAPVPLTFISGEATFSPQGYRARYQIDSELPFVTGLGLDQDFTGSLLGSALGMEYRYPGGDPILIRQSPDMVRTSAPGFTRVQFASFVPAATVEPGQMEVTLIGNVVSSTGLFPMDLSLVPLADATDMVGMMDGEVLTLRRASKTLTTVSADLTQVTRSTALAFGEIDPSAVIQLSDIAIVPGSRELLAARWMNWELYRIDSTTGETTALGSIAPTIVDSELMGHSRSPALLLAVGEAPALAPSTGWLMR